MLLWFGIPIFIVYRRPKHGERNLRLRFWLAALVTWLVLCLHWLLFGLPVARELALARGNTMYDGVSGNVAILLFGWMYGIIGAVTAMLAFKAGEAIRAKRRESAKTP